MVKENQISTLYSDVWLNTSYSEVAKNKVFKLYKGEQQSIQGIIVGY